LLSLDDAVAFLFHYEDGEWKFYDEVSTNGYTKNTADAFVEYLINDRFGCK